MAKDDWERKIKKVTKLDPGRRSFYSRPLIEAMFALDQMKAVHGKSPFTTHGISGIRLAELFPPGTHEWNKDYEYRIFVKDSLLREETAFEGRPKLDDRGWLSLEAYAIENTGIKEDIVYKGNLFRHSYQGCSERLGCITKHKDGSMDIDNECRQKCQNLASEESDFFTKDELNHIRKASGNLV